MNKVLIFSMLAASISSWACAAHAQAEPGATAGPESTLAFNAGVVSDYRYRGISQTRLDPALQAGVDYADKSGFYVDAWGSTIKWIKDTPGVTSGSRELDLYGGYKWTSGDFAYDLGFLRYEYLSNNYNKAKSGGVNASTNEIYGALSYGLFTAKYSHAISDLFGNVDSKNSYYLDLSAAIDLGNGYSLTPHVGRQGVRNHALASYNDYALTLAKDLGHGLGNGLGNGLVNGLVNGLSVSASVIGTNATSGVYVSPANKDLGQSGLVVGLKYSF